MVVGAIKRFFVRLAGPSLLAFLFVLAGASGAQAASVHITGVVTNPIGGAVQNVTVTATAAGGSTILFGPSTTAANGSYQLDVDPGTYDFHYLPPSGSGLNSAVT